ncbi:MAG: glycosyltransferase [Acidobacteriota bacterium]|nr:glycosyltransferase [Acidobacteriota bacterium]
MNAPPRRICILLNSLQHGDAVSNHCILLRTRFLEMGISAEIYAESFEDKVANEGLPASRLLDAADTNDILLHQFYNDTALIPLVEQFPGRRVMLYQNITPPEYFPEGSPLYDSCRRGLRLARSLPPLYDLSLGMTEFSRNDLAKMGYSPTGVVPLFIDVEAIRARGGRDIRRGPRDGLTTFLFVGRVAPNKKFEDLLEFIAAYKSLGKNARLIAVGDDRQIPEYTERLMKLARKLALRRGGDFVFTGKIPDAEVADYYRNADAFLCMSEHEGFCAPLLESMAFDLPTFAYAAPACEEVMGSGGVLFRDKNFPAMALAVATTLEDPSRRAEILAAQREHLEAFRPEEQRKTLCALLDRIATLPSRAAAFSLPRVSVVINTFNRAGHIDRCLQSLEKQTYRNFEVVVVNGPSTDDTAKRLEAYKDKIHVAHTDSRVLCVSRNIGIREGRGELIAFIDDDAAAEPNWLRELVFAFADSTVGAVGGLVYRMQGGNIEFRNGTIDRKGSVQWDLPQPGQHWDWEEDRLNTVSGNCCIFRRSALEGIGGFDEEIEYYHDEADVVMRLRTAGFRTLHRPRAIVYHEAARSHNRASRHHLNWFVITKNTLYVALKNYSGQEDLRAAARSIVAQIVRERMKPIWEWWMRREITLGDLWRMEAQCARGIRAGLRKGLHPSPKLVNLGPANGAGFRPYPVVQATQLSVCLLSQSLPRRSPGGVGTYTVALARGLRDLDCAVHIVSRGEKDSTELRDGIWRHTTAALPVARAIGLNGKYPSAARNLDYSRGAWSKVLDIAARWGLDILESPSWDAEGLVAAIENRLPVVIRLVSPMFKIMETQEWTPTPDLELCCELEALAVRRAAGVVGSTRAIFSSVTQRYQVQPAQAAVIPFGLDLPRSAPGNSLAGSKRVLFVGRLERRKGIHILLEAIPRVLDACPSAVFDIVGRDVEVSIAETWRAAHPELRDRVSFHGEVSDNDLSRFYDDCDILAAPSLYESYGLIFVEAMARGKAVVGTTAGGIPEVVRDGETGLLVPPGDSAALALALIRLLEDEPARNRMARKASEDYVKQFSQEAMARGTLEFYQKVIKSRKSGEEEVWKGNAVDFGRPAWANIAWEPVAQCLYLTNGTSARGEPLCYGPYIPLKGGNYRAEFALWADDCGCTIDVFSAAFGILEARELSGSDFPFGRASIFQLYFRIPESGADGMQFRVHATGTGKIHVRQIRVVRCA